MNKGLKMDTSTQNTPPYSPLTVCREILHIGEAEGIDNIIPLKLIKLAFLSHGFHLAILDKPLFKDEIEVWPYGPVIKGIYFAVHYYGREPVDFRTFDHIKEELGAEQKNIIKGVMNSYQQYTAGQLSSITHRKGSPWDIMMAREGINATIPDKLIKKHYKKVMKDSGKA